MENIKNIMSRQYRHTYKKTPGEKFLEFFFSFLIVIFIIFIGIPYMFIGFNKFATYSRNIQQQESIKYSYSITYENKKYKTNHIYYWSESNRISFVPENSTEEITLSNNYLIEKTELKEK